MIESDAKTPCAIEGMCIATSIGTSVLGGVDEPSGDYFWRFVNAEGRATYLRLSAEAVEAMVHIWSASARGRNGTH